MPYAVKPRQALLDHNTGGKGKYEGARVRLAVAHFAEEGELAGLDLQALVRLGGRRQQNPKPSGTGFYNLSFQLHRGIAQENYGYAAVGGKARGSASFQFKSSEPLIGN
jgi:hypothetical protein